MQWCLCLDCCRAVQTFNAAITKMVGWILWTSPVGVASLIAASICRACSLWATLGALGLWVLTVVRARCAQRRSTTPLPQGCPCAGSANGTRWDTCSLDAAAEPDCLIQTLNLLAWTPSQRAGSTLCSAAGLAESALLECAAALAAARCHRQLGCRLTWLLLGHHAAGA